MTKFRALVVMAVILLAGIGVNTYFTLHDHAALVSTTKESADTRVTTVTQRCELTGHIYHRALLAETRLTPVEDLESIHWFLESYEGCEKQLAKVRHIAAHAP